MALQGLEIRQSSAGLRGTHTGIRNLPTVSKYIDTTICIDGLRGAQVPFELAPGGSAALTIANHALDWGAG